MVPDSALDVDGHVPADGLAASAARGRLRPLRPLAGGAVEAAAVDGVLGAAAHQVQRRLPRRHGLLSQPDGLK